MFLSIAYGTPADIPPEMFTGPSTGPAGSYTGPWSSWPIWLTTTKSKPIICDYDWIETPRHDCFYFSFSIEVDWLEAQTRCKRIDGYLAEITDAETHEFVNMFIKTLQTSGRVWIGGNDIGIEGYWRWIQSGNEISQIACNIKIQLNLHEIG